MTVGYTSYCSGNVKNGPGLYLHDGLIMNVMKTWMRNRPTPSMNALQKLSMTDSIVQNDDHDNKYDDEWTRWVDECGEIEYLPS